MIARTIATTVVTLATVAGSVRAGDDDANAVAPEITVLEDGFNVVARIPCVGCPFLERDRDGDLNGEQAWRVREVENSLVSWLVGGVLHSSLLFLVPLFVFEKKIGVLLFRF